MDTNKLLLDYDVKIMILARMVAGKRTAIIDDLAQIGRAKLIKIADKHDPSKGATLWTYVADPIIKAMRRSISNDGLTVVADNRHKRTEQMSELDPNLEAKPITTENPEAETILQKIESEIEGLPSLDRIAAQAYIRSLHRKAKDVRAKASTLARGKEIIDAIKARYAVEAAEALGR